MDIDEPLPTYLEETSKEYAMHVLDRDIEQLQRRAVALKQYRNSFASISSLPAEVLCSIFSFVRAHYTKMAVNSVGWLQLTHVSHRWRQIAIGSSTLWTLIDNPILNSRLLLETILERSAGPLLSLNADARLHPLVVPGLALALRNHDRIRCISVVTPPGEWNRMRHAFLGPFPQLERLSLTCLPPDSSAIFDLEDTLSELPKLQRLDISNFQVDWRLLSSFKFHALTYLQLRDLHPHTPTWNQLADALRAMPNLENLDIRNSLPERDPMNANSVRAYLPSLRTLLVDASPTQAARNLLRFCITVPSTTNISIRCYDHRFLDLQDVIYDLLSEVGQPQADIHSFQTFILLTSVTKDPIRHSGIHVKLYVDALSDEEMLSHSRIVPRLELDLCWEVKSASLNLEASESDFVIANIFRAMSLHYIKNLYLVSIPTKLSTATFSNTFGMLPQLNFVMAGSWCDILVDALDPKTGPAGRNVICFPSLSSLYLHGHVYDPRWEQYRNLRFDDAELAAVPVKKLSSCLRHRSKAGAKIDTLTFKAYPRLRRVDVDRLQPYVLRPVEWIVDGSFYSRERL